MFTKTNTTTTMTALAVAAALTACGGGGGGDSASTTPTSPTSVTSSGVITGFGSVIVNGVRYETENSQIVSADDGTVLVANPTDSQVQAVLGVGEVVRLSGTRSDDSNGRADVIRVDDELVGEVTSVSDADASFEVLGQTVGVTPDTIIDDSIVERVRRQEIANDVRFGDLRASETLTALLSNLAVEVSGFPTDNGVEATRIEDVNDDNFGDGLPGNRNAEVKGFVRDVTNISSGMFTLNGLTIQFNPDDASDIFDSEDFPGGPSDLSEGDFIEVKGTPLSGPIFDAIEVEREDDFRGDDDRGEGEFEIEGIITSIDPATNTVVIGGVEIQVDDLTGLSEGLRVEIKGQIQGNTLVNIRVEDENEDTVRTEDVVAENGVDSVAGTITTRLGLEITPNSRTRLEDDTDAGDDDDENLSPAEFLARVQGGDRIDARGFPRDGSVTWTRVERDDDNDGDCRLRGPVDDGSITGDAASFTFTIQGVTINTDDLRDAGFRADDDVIIGRTEFFAQLDDSDVVQATSDDATGCADGMLSTGSGGEVQFEVPDDGIGGGIGGGDDNGGDDNGNDDNGGIVGGDDISGTVSNLSADGDSGTFDVAGRTVTVSPDTLIDS